MCTVQIGASLRRIKEQYFAAQQLYPLYDTANGTELVTFTFSHNTMLRSRGTC
jgi:hypothetical protein